jgi:hypothetical protein
MDPEPDDPTLAVDEAQRLDLKSNFDCARTITLAAAGPVPITDALTGSRIPFFK